MQSWGVVATVKEPAELLAAFAAHYASIGADDIHIFLDGSDDAEARRLLARVPNTRITVADDAYYRDRWTMARPEHLFRRQRLNATDAYRAGRTDWLLHVDADEYLQSGDFAAELSALPEDVDTLRIRNGERVFEEGARLDSVFDGVMLNPHRLTPRGARKVFSERVRRFSDMGFLGHRLGKSVTRTGRHLKLGIHKPQKGGGVRSETSNLARLCHFDGVTELHWVLKLLRYRGLEMYREDNTSQRFRNAQIEYIHAAEDGTAALALHRDLRVYAPDRVAQLREDGHISTIALDPMFGVARYFAAGEIDLSPAAFDAKLAANMPDLYQTLMAA